MRTPPPLPTESLGESNSDKTKPITERDSLSLAWVKRFVLLAGPLASFRSAHGGQQIDSPLLSQASILAMVGVYEQCLCLELPRTVGVRRGSCSIRRLNPVDDRSRGMQGNSLTESRPA